MNMMPPPGLSMQSIEIFFAYSNQDILAEIGSQANVILRLYLF